MIKDKKQSEDVRPPVVVVLGHVDHGKSSILEAIKDLKITEKESGGITQHIGAYEIEHNKKKITFIDTPGHEAFSAMRSRGAKIADIAILVIAADEGIKPQTKEAITHASGLPMIIAINKMDKPGADAEKVKRELSAQDILVESMGGKIPSINVSAKTKQGIDELIELILLVAEMEDLKEDKTGVAEGAVIESYMDSLRGPTATLIMQKGTLKQGDILGTDSAVGKVKSLENFKGRPLKQAGSSLPAIVLGFESVPVVGEKVKIYSNIEEAKKVLEKPSKLPLESSVVEQGKRVLNLILKADVFGSLEAIEEVLKDLPQEKSALKVLKAEVGDINDSDVKLAIGSNAKIIGFRVKTNPIAQKLALREKLTIINFEVIYELAQAVRNLLEKIIGSETVKIDLGKVKVLAIFRTEKKRQIIGGKVTEGKIRKGVSLEVWRNEEQAGKGKVVNLQKNKKEIAEVEKGSECGIVYQGNVKIEQDDVLEAYVEEKRKIEL